MNCNICNLDITNSFRVDKIVGICMQCRQKAGWTICIFCHTSAIPPDANGDGDPSQCKYCSNATSGYGYYGAWLAKYGKLAAQATVNLTSNTVAINNYTCPSCKNDKCNRQEKSCWRCGTEIHA